MNKLQKLALNNYKTMTPRQMKQITGGYEGGSCTIKCHDTGCSYNIASCSRKDAAEACGVPEDSHSFGTCYCH